MKKMDKHKKRGHNKDHLQLPASKLKKCFTDLASMSDEEHVEHYLKIREQKFDQMKYYAPKTVNITRHEITPVSELKTDRVISLDSDMKLDKALKNKNKRHKKQNCSTIPNINKSNDRLVIELEDYLTLTETKNIVKFKLKPISDNADKPDKLSSINDVIKTANTVQFNQILNYGQTNEESQRTFLLVPQSKADCVNKKSKVHKKQMNDKKSEAVQSSELSSPIKTFQTTEQINHKKSSIQLTNAQEGSIKNIRLKIADNKNSKPETQLQKKEESHPLIKVVKKAKVQHSKTHSNLDKGNNACKEKKKVVLRSHPYFAQHKPFVIRHRPMTKVTEHQNASVTNQQENFVISETNLESVLKHNELIDEMKCEVLEHDLNLVMSQEIESIDQIFPVALKSNDSDDFEYLSFQTTTEEISTDEMQILGI